MMRHRICMLHLVYAVLLWGEHSRPILSKPAAKMSRKLLMLLPLWAGNALLCGFHSPSLGVKSHASLWGSSCQASHLCSPHYKMHAGYLVPLIPEWHLHAWLKKVLTRRLIFRVHYRYNAGQSRRQPPECPTQNQSRFRIRTSDFRVLPLCSL